MQRETKGTIGFLLLGILCGVCLLPAFARIGRTEKKAQTDDVIHLEDKFDLDENELPLIPYEKW